jgi:hypothetical protein
MGLTRPYDFLFDAVGAQTAETIAVDNASAFFAPVSEGANSMDSSLGGEP